MAYGLNRYDPSNWYWLVGGDETRAWSSARAAYVPTASDPVYLAWLAQGLKPTLIGTEADLQQVLAEQYPAGWPPSLPQQAGLLVMGGLAITSAGTPGIDGTYACDAAAISHVSAEMLSVVVTGAFADGAKEVVWADIAGGLHTFPSPDAFKPFAVAMAAFVAAAQKVIIGASTTLPANAAAIP